MTGQNTGQLVLGAAGAAVGAYFGGVQGASLGYAIGSSAGGLLDSALADPIQGPRLSDLNVSTSTYGNAIPRIRGGAVRLPGNVIWSTGLRESKKTSKGGSGKGPKTAAYSYSAAWAVAFCEGEVGELLRLWADGRLVLDNTGGSEVVQVKGLSARWHRGTESQTPDPALAEALGEWAPAHRGLAYLVVEAELAEFGNRLPGLTAEIAADAAPAGLARPFAALEPGSPATTYPAPAVFGTALAVDWGRGLSLRQARGGGGLPSGVAVFDAAAGGEARSADVDSMLARGGLSAGDVFTLNAWQDAAGRWRSHEGLGALALAPNGAAYGCAGITACGQKLLRFDPYSLAVTGSYGTETLFPSDAADCLFWPEALVPVPWMDEAGARCALLAVSPGGNLRLVDGDAMGPLLGAPGDPRAGAGGGGAGGAAPLFRFDKTVACAGGLGDLGARDLWLANSPAGGGGGGGGGGAPAAAVDLWRLRVGATAGDRPAGFAPEARLSGLDLGFPPGARPGCAALDFDATDGGLLLRAADRGGAFPARLAKWLPGEGVQWTVPLPAPFWEGRAPGGGLSRVSAPAFGLQSGGLFLAVDTLTGETLFSGPVAGTDTGGEAQAWDAETRTVLLANPASGPFWGRVALARAAARPAPLADVVRALCVADAGLDPADVEAEGLEGEVRGIAVAQQPVRDALRMLGAAHNFDGFEAGARLRFVHRGGPALATLAPADAVRPRGAGGADDAGAQPDTRAPDLELPRRVTVAYRDVDRDQQPGAAGWQRARDPVQVVAGKAEANLDFSALVMTNAEARATARRALLEHWAGRDTWRDLRFGFDRLALEPGDPVELLLAGPDGPGAPPAGAVRARIERAELGADNAVAFHLAAEESAAYALPPPPPAPGAGFAAQRIEAPSPSRLLMADLPLLRDADETGGAALRAYAAAGAHRPGWRGAGLFVSRDGGASYAAEEMVPRGAAWGTAVAALPAPRSPWSTDRANVLRVSVVDGADRIRSATRAQLWAGANAAALAGAGGLVEVLQFESATAEAAGVVALRGLLRGRRGTEAACGAAGPGALFWLLEPDALERLALPLSDLGAPRRWRLLGRGDDFDAAPAETRTAGGRAERPLSPVRLRGARDAGTGDLLVTWLRRTRVGGGWRNGAGSDRAPLAEAAEAYVLEVLGADGAPARTMAGLASPSALYTAAMRAEDFPGAPASAPVRVRVAQLSAAVGRGDPAEATL